MSALEVLRSLDTALSMTTAGNVRFMPVSVGRVRDETGLDVSSRLTQRHEDIEQDRVWESGEERRPFTDIPSWSGCEKKV